MSWVEAWLHPERSTFVEPEPQTGGPTAGLMFQLHITAVFTLIAMDAGINLMVLTKKTMTFRQALNNMANGLLSLIAMSKSQRYLFFNVG